LPKHRYRFLINNIFNEKIWKDFSGVLSFWLPSIKNSINKRGTEFTPLRCDHVKGSGNSIFHNTRPLCFFITLVPGCCSCLWGQRTRPRTGWPRKIRSNRRRPRRDDSANPTWFWWRHQAVSRFGRNAPPTAMTSLVFFCGGGVASDSDCVKIKSVRIARKKRVTCLSHVRDRCYDFLNIFAEKFSEKFGVLGSNYC
jgi:hypothetical protein